MSAPRILLVDDSRQVSRMLRTSLELSGREYVVVDVPSGEEALLELTRGPVDLLVADLVLPGISGLELLERVRQFNPHARAIMITGHPTEEARERAEALGVIAFMRKPIRTSYFLEAVERALQLTGDAAPRRAVMEDRRQEMAQQLTTIRQELSAESALLLDGEGRVVARSQDVLGLALDSALPALAAAFGAGLKVSGLLGAAQPHNFQYLDGETHDMYLTNIGPDHALLIVFRGRQEAGQMGAVVHYGRRAAAGLLGMLGRTKDEPESPEKATKSKRGEPEKNTVGATESPRPDPAVDDADRYWETAVSGASGQAAEEGKTLSYEDALKRGLMPSEPAEAHEDDP